MDNQCQMCTKTGHGIQRSFGGVNNTMHHCLNACACHYVSNVATFDVQIRQSKKVHPREAH